MAEDTYNDTAHANHSPFTIFVGKTNNASDLDYSGFSSEVVENNTTTGWDLNENYARIEITIASGESIVVVSDERTAGGQQGQLNLIQITDVPEPSTLALTVLGLLGLTMWGRRRRKVVDRITTE
jgi:hypothetical protein